MTAEKLLVRSGLALFFLAMAWGQGSAASFGERGSKGDAVVAGASVLTNDTFLINLFLAVSTARMGGHHVVKTILDGHTLLLDDNERVRLMGVELDDVNALGGSCEGALGNEKSPVAGEGPQHEAVAFAEKLVEGQRVRIEHDRAKSPLLLREREGEPLVYVFLEDGTFVNAEIIKEGYGRADARFPFRLMDEFLSYERDAKRQHRGLWAAVAGRTSHCEE